MMKKLTAPITIALIFLTGCAGHNFNENNVLNLQAGITTPQRAEELLGQKHDSYSDDKGDYITWMYATSSGGPAPNVKVLQLRFNDDVLSCVRVLSGFNPTLAEQAGLQPCEGTVKYKP